MPLFEINYGMRGRAREGKQAFLYVGLAPPEPEFG